MRKASNSLVTLITDVNPIIHHPVHLIRNILHEYLTFVPSITHQAYAKVGWQPHFRYGIFKGVCGLPAKSAIERDSEIETQNFGIG